MKKNQHTPTADNNGLQNVPRQEGNKTINDQAQANAVALQTANNTIELLPPPPPPQGGVVAEAADDANSNRRRRINLSGFSKNMRKIVQAKEDADNNTIVEKFIAALLNPASTRATIAEALSHTTYSTISNNIKYSDSGSIKLNTLDRRLRQAYANAEAQMRVVLQAEFDERFNAQPIHSPEELHELDEMCKKISHPFKNRFTLQDAQAA